MKYSGVYVPPTLTVDLVLFRLTPTGLEVLLTKRANDPFKGDWALPGGYCAQGQTTLEALAAITRRKVDVDIDTQLRYVEQLYTFDTVARDPRGHAVSVTYMGCGYDIAPTAAEQSVEWHSVDRLPTLAYDHAEIISYARERLASKLSYTNVAANLLDKKFTLSQLQFAYESVMGRELDKRNFRKKFLSLGLIHETGDTWREGAHRPAAQYAFNSEGTEVLTRSFE